MEPVFSQSFPIDDGSVDCFGRLKPSALLLFIQELSGRHCEELSVGVDALARQRLGWVVTRHRVQLSRVPRLGETIRIETWPMPTTRVAYPRSVVAYDADGHECFRAISLWVLLNLDTRAMILPGKSGIIVRGTVRGGELPSPAGLLPHPLGSVYTREVRFTDIDRNGHMNNSRYLDWVDDLFPSEFHRTHTLREFTVCYNAEAREGQSLLLHYGAAEDGAVQVEAERDSDGQSHRVFTALLRYESA